MELSTEKVRKDLQGFLRFFKPGYKNKRIIIPLSNIAGLKNYNIFNVCNNENWNFLTKFPVKAKFKISLKKTICTLFCYPKNFLKN